MKNKRECKLFFKFLKQHKCLDAFVHNIKCYSSLPPQMNEEWEKASDLGKLLIFLKWREKEPIGAWIDIAFCWGNTPQDHKYWRKLNDLWQSQKL
jgi:hypothetical protein